MLFELIADGWMVKPEFLVSGAVASGIETAYFFLLVDWVGFFLFFI